MCTCIVAFTVGIVAFVFRHYDTKDNPVRNIDIDKAMSDVVQLNIVIFFATLFSTSRASILFIVDKCLGRQIAPTTLGIINILLKTMCIVLFDFRIIHVGQTNHDTRLMILYADIASNCFSEACQEYSCQSPAEQRQTCSRCIKHRHKEEEELNCNGI